MCLGIPMEIKSIENFSARCEAKGVVRDVGLMLLQHEQLEPGDYVVVHLGNAIEKVSKEEAMAAWEIYDEMVRLARDAG